METSALNFGGRELPSYLGYGILDRESVRFENDVITASYVLDLDGSVVHKLTWEKTRCTLETFLHGAFAGYSTYRDLNYALSYDFLTRDLSADKVYGFLALQASGMGNIFVELPDTSSGKDPRIAYYPAGFLLSFRLPLPNNDGKFSRFLESIQGRPEIKAHRYLEARLLLADTDGKQTTRKVGVAEFIVAVAYLTRAAGIFARSGVICPEKEFRLMVTESYHAEKTFSQSFVGTVRNPWFAYTYDSSQTYVSPGVITRNLGENLS